MKIMENKQLGRTSELYNDIQTLLVSAGEITRCVRNREDQRFCRSNTKKNNASFEKWAAADIIFLGEECPPPGEEEDSQVFLTENKKIRIFSSASLFETRAFFPKENIFGI